MNALPAIQAQHRELDGLASPAEQVKLAFLLGYAEGATRDAYMRDLNQYLDWCDGQRLDALAVRRVHVDAYARTLEAAGRAKATVARKLSVLSKFYEYAVNEEIIARSPLPGVRRPKIDSESQTLGLDRDQATRFLTEAEHDSPVAHALASLLLLNGLRVTEACSLDVDSVTAQRGHRTIAFEGKGGRTFTVPLPPQSVLAVERAAGARRSGPLLAREDGTRVDRFTAIRIIARLAKRVGAAKITPHSLRHTYVTMGLDAGVPLRDMQQAARHKDPKTTIRYDRARRNLDGHASYAVAQWLAGGS